MIFDIEKRAESLFPNERGYCRDKSIQLALEAADARAEEIAVRLEQRAEWEEKYVHKSVSHERAPAILREQAARARRSMCQPETREARLERALRDIADPHGTGFPMDIARRALSEPQDAARAAGRRTLPGGQA